MNTLTESGWNRMWRRIRKLEGEGYKVATRLADHAMLMERQRNEAQQCSDWAQNDTAKERRYSRHLENRLNEVFSLLTDDQRAEMEHRDSEREPFVYEE